MFLLSEWWIYHARQEKLAQDSIKTYRPADFSWQRQEIRHYHNKFLVSEYSSYGLRDVPQMLCYHNNHFVVRMVDLPRSAKLSAMGCTSVLLIASNFVSGRKYAIITTNFWCQSIAATVHRDKLLDGTYSLYFPFRNLRDVPQMLCYHNKIKRPQRLLVR